MATVFLALCAVASAAPLIDAGYPRSSAAALRAEERAQDAPQVPL